MTRDNMGLTFTLDNLPDWICPTCQRGILRLKDNSFVKEETRKSLEAWNEQDFELEWIEYLYSCVLVCSDKNCEEHVLNIGVGCIETHYDWDESGYSEEINLEVFSPRYFQPHLRLIHLPKRCPESVQQALDKSFRLFFADSHAALNSARIAVEELLTELGIKRYTIVVTKQGRRERRVINLHNRIELLSKKYPHLRQLLLAYKWLGNAGSHAGKKVDTKDVLDSYTLIEHILEEIYKPRRKAIDELARQINKAKGPIKRKKKVIKP